tara:strand:+ start:228 stop:416 length:189 start_codon:yes stop_codon:yes gene_type:complete
MKNMYQKNVMNYKSMKFKQEALSGMGAFTNPKAFLNATRGNLIGAPCSNKSKSTNRQKPRKR